MPYEMNDLYAAMVADGWSQADAVQSVREIMGVFDELRPGRIPSLSDMLRILEDGSRRAERAGMPLSEGVNSAALSFISGNRKPLSQRPDFEAEMAEFAWRYWGSMPKDSGEIREQRQAFVNILAVRDEQFRILDPILADQVAEQYGWLYSIAPPVGRESSWRVPQQSDWAMARLATVDREFGLKAGDVIRSKEGVLVGKVVSVSNDGSLRISAMGGSFVFKLERVEQPMSPVRPVQNGDIITSEYTVTVNVSGDRLGREISTTPDVPARDKNPRELRDIDLAL